MSNIAAGNVSAKGIFKKIGDAIKNVVNPPEPQWVKDAWAALSPQEQFTVNRMSECFPHARSSAPIPHGDFTKACADVILNRGGKLPDSAEKYFDALTPSEKKIAEFAQWRADTRRIVSWDDYGEMYKQVVQLRGQADEFVAK